MEIRWYLCPYDVMPFRESAIVRRPAIARYIPVVPNLDGSNWDEVEIMGNHIIVKVDAPASVHTLIASDPDFLVIPSTLPLGVRPLLQNKLLSLGYTQSEIDSVEWNIPMLLALLSTVVSNWRVNAARNGITLLPGRKTAPKTVADIQERFTG